MLRKGKSLVLTGDSASKTNLASLDNQKLAALEPLLLGNDPNNGHLQTGLALVSLLHSFLDTWLSYTGKNFLLTINFLIMLIFKGEGRRVSESTCSLSLMGYCR